MTTTLEDSNAALRQAVESRMAAAPSETYAVWTPPAFAATRAEQTLHNALAAVRDRHGKYGPPAQHFGRTVAMVNAAFGTSFTAADWALIMVLDKIARQLGTAATEDAAVDIAGYAACHEECRVSRSSAERRTAAGLDP